VGRRNIGKRYFKTLHEDKGAGVMSKNKSGNQTIFSRLQATSTNITDMDLEAISSMRTDGQNRFRPALSGMLSPNPQTGTVKVNFDRFTMSIVV